MIILGQLFQLCLNNTCRKDSALPSPKSKKRKCEVTDKQIWRHLGGYNTEQKRKSQDRNKQKRHPQYARMECSTDNKPNQACEWVILGRESSPLCLRPVHFDIYIAKIFSWRQVVNLLWSQWNCSTYARGEFGSQRTFLCNDLDNEPSKLILRL